MIRHVRLSRYTPLSARSGLARSSPARQARPAVPADARATLAARSGGWCEVQRPGICTGRAVDPHHRILQGAGGTHGAAKTRSDRLANVVHACRACHSWIHASGNRKAAERLGLIVPRWRDPARVPVALLTYDAVYRVWLDDAGGWHRLEDGQP